MKEKCWIEYIDQCGVVKVPVDCEPLYEEDCEDITKRDCKDVQEECISPDSTPLREWHFSSSLCDTIA